jgi:hypothetical protein
MNYRKVTSSNMSDLEAHDGFFRLLMKGDFLSLSTIASMLIQIFLPDMCAQWVEIFHNLGFLFLFGIKLSCQIF